MAQSRDIIVKEGIGEAPSIVGGDFQAGLSDTQHLSYLSTSEKGNFLRTPRVGAGIRQFLNGPIKRTTISRVLRKEAIKDGYNVISLQIKKDGTVDLRATRTNDPI